MNLTLLDLALLGCSPLQTWWGDDWESYGVGWVTDDMQGGVGFTGPWVFNIGRLGILAADYFENYADLADLNGLSDGYGFTGGYTSRDSYRNIVKAQDDFESYSDGANLNGLNNGSGFAAAYASR
jgi:hypothetical protein